MRNRNDYVEDLAAFPHEAYRVKETWARGVAFRVLGWEIAPRFEDSETYDQTGKVTIRMIGDDRHWYVDFDDLDPLKEDAYCWSCGQIGCTHVVPVP